MRRLSATEAANGAFLDRFEVETSHDSGGTAKTHRLRVEAALRRFGREFGYLPSLAAVLGDGAVLGAILQCDRSLKGEGQISRATVIGTRNSFAAVVAWLPPDVGPGREVARCALAEARRSSTRQVGLRRLTIAGRAASIDQRPVPSEREVGAGYGGACMTCSAWERRQPGRPPSARKP